MNGTTLAFLACRVLALAAVLLGGAHVIHAVAVTVALVSGDADGQWWAWLILWANPVLLIGVGLWLWGSAGWLSERMVRSGSGEPMRIDPADALALGLAVTGAAFVLWATPGLVMGMANWLHLLTAAEHEQPGWVVMPVSPAAQLAAGLCLAWWARPIAARVWRARGGEVSP